MEVVSFLVVAGGLFAALFLAVFFFKRRVGVLGLALAAGSILSTLWVGSLTPVVAEAGIIIIQPPLSSLLAVVLTLLPAFLLFFSGAAAKGKMLRLVSALVFAGLAIAFLAETLGSALVMDDNARMVYDRLIEYKPAIITVGLALSLADLIIGKKMWREKEARH